ncbi:hypothetical protein [Alicyclobacillus herbarius]|uniref:hypothetical protein n=1 Tax=Alicyclobacillus herbarius TaxID=122960 RepID=UPI0004246555|nr:hypothetical protein [Alicyclobacillus herbarius]
MKKKSSFLRSGVLTALAACLLTVGRGAASKQGTNGTGGAASTFQVGLGADTVGLNVWRLRYLGVILQR